MPTIRAYVPHVGWLAHEPGDDLVRLLRQGYFEADEQAFAWLYLRPGDCFLDCGAHIGLYSVLASRATDGRARVLSVEANDETARLLQTNLRENAVEGARVVRAAVWSAPGTVRFLKDAPERSAYARVSFDASEPGAVEVPATTLDALVELSGASEIALVKLDLEGAELEAFAGAATSLARGACAVLMVEFTEQNLQRRGSSTAKLAAAIAGHGLRLFELSTEQLGLVPFTVDGPVWFKNVFVTADPDRVNARLHAASQRNLEIARDVLGRAQACSRLAELDDLDRLRALVGSHERWALATEALLANEREITADLRRQLEDAKGRRR